MKKIERIIRIAALPAAIAMATEAHALQLNRVSSANTGGVSTVMFDFDQQAAAPSGFMLQNPPRLVFDFPSANAAKNLPKSFAGKGLVNKINVVHAGSRVRATLALSKNANYLTEKKGNRINILVMDDANKTRPSAPATAASGGISDQEWVNQFAKVSGLMDDKKTMGKRSADMENKTAPLMQPVKRGSSALPEVKSAPQIALQRAQAPARQNAAQRGYSTIRSTNRALPKAQVQTRHTNQNRRPVAQHHHAQQNRHAQGLGGRMLGAIDFRRDEKGNGHVIINLPDNRVMTEVSQAGNSVIANIKGVRLREDSKNYDVIDFATPVNSIRVQRRGADARIRILARGDYNYTSRKEGNQLHIHVNRVEKRLTAEDLRKKKKVYKGDKLTLNFQDIEVRSVLQLLADFTDKNIVVSDSVNGSITLRLKDVPWDQAMDIVLRSKGLGMRENGNVIWVAPESELAARENRELEQLQKKKKLEPLVTEYIPVNFAKATDLIDLIKQSTGANTTSRTTSLLSDRGSISVDPRTNTLLVSDTADRVSDIRAMVKKLDVPVRQVSIESRIVIASDTFTKELGTRFGVTGLAGFNGNRGLITSSGSLNATDSVASDAASNLGSTGNVFPVGVPSLDDRLSVNLPAAGATGRFGFSILSKDYLVDLELSALQAENKGEIISTPRVVTTNQTKAIIEQGVEIPFLQASSSGAANVAFKKAVLSLEVTPQITPEEHVIMDLKVNQDTVGQVFSGVPSINTREVQTNVLVDNGQTVVLGGVHEETNSNDVEKVPVLGDLPIVGRAFKRTRRQNDKRELLIFVTPKILD